MVHESSILVAGPSSLPSAESSRRSKTKRKRSIVETSEPSSSTSTSKSKHPQNDDESRPKSRKKKSRAKDKIKGKRKLDVDALEMGSAPHGNASFDNETDFIALMDSDEDEESARIRDREAKGKGKKKELGKSLESERSRRKHSPRRSLDSPDDRGKNRDRDRDWERDRDKDRKRKGRQKTPEREWDRGKRRDHDRDRRRYDQPISASVRSIRDRKLPWLEGLDLFGCHNVAELLHMEVEAFTNWISPSPVEDEIRSLLVHQITSAITSRFQDAEVYPFGSYATKLYLPTGDIDLVVLSDTMRITDKHVVLRSLAEVIKRNGIAYNVSIIAKAKVPIVKFVTTHGHIPVDISINQGNGTVGANVVNGFLRDMSTSTTASHPKLEGSIALRALVMITKTFLSQRSMNEVYTGGLGSYSIVSLVISFLQMHPKIRRGEIDADQNLGVLLIEFFELYGSFFNYDNVGMSVRDGGTYFNKRQRGWYNDSSNYKGKGGPSSLSIEDPIDISNDISSGSYGFAKVRATFAGAHSILTATAYLKAGILSARRSGQTTKLRPDDYYRLEEMSLLSHIIDINQDIINHRRIVQEVYDTRILHNLLNVKPRVIVVEDKPSIKTLTLSNGHHSPAMTSHDPAHGESAPGTSNQNPIDLEEGEISMVISSSPQENNLDGVNTDEEEGENQNSRDERKFDSEDDSGKYDISGRQPPKKRLKTGGPMDTHTVEALYITDSDDDEDNDDDASSESELDSVAAEEAEYDLDVIDAEISANIDNAEDKVGGDTVPSEPVNVVGQAGKKPSSNGGNGKKRSYWLSKGVVSESIDDVENED
ncbi:hypothetical protein J3R30DRAFT_3481689 [Lentinula aciculospora]|uniref:polynucleotide adenylyltransferase n=1 Tax=Lentinula aciculospora TaxID=153920 RepID=A0A9W9ABJ2_9AGAR|nr:hypothetical protein J3R30DRAFT_3481689 [Lentinula aciculospora]